MYFVSVLEGETLSKVCSYTGADKYKDITNIFSVHPKSFFKQMMFFKSLAHLLM